MTRSQRYLDLALRHVEAIRDDTSPDDDRRRIYGGLCHTFPVLVRTNGLCQTLAFIAAKSAADDTEPSDQAQAYRDLSGQVAEVLGIEGDPLRTVRRAGLSDYMRYTRTILDAWVYYRRFAVSVLKVDAGSKGEPPS